ncbi:hypothetical protein PUN4_140005 [Paraburkholderia unamae]|nr:hypothetical protein PUN4_140005 [Paraburkholderia unamae]
MASATLAIFVCSGGFVAAVCRSAGSELAQRHAIVDADRAAFALDDAALLQRRDHARDRFAAHLRHGRDRALIGQLDEREIARQPLADGRLDHGAHARAGARLAMRIAGGDEAHIALRHEVVQRARDIGIAEQLARMGAVEQADHAVLGRGDIGAHRHAVEDGNLARAFARIDDTHREFRAVLGIRRDAQLTFDEENERCLRISLEADVIALLDGCNLGESGCDVNDFVSCIAKQNLIFQYVVMGIHCLAHRNHPGEANERSLELSCLSRMFCLFFVDESCFCSDRVFSLSATGGAWPLVSVVGLSTI